jgi:hypothetical protein
MAAEASELDDVAAPAWPVAGTVVATRAPARSASPPRPRIANRPVEVCAIAVPLFDRCA